LRQCKTCLSPHRKEYEQLFLKEGVPVIRIWRLARGQYNEEISYKNFLNHFKKHLGIEDKTIPEMEKERKEILSKLFREDIELSNKIREHLKLIEEQIHKKAEEGFHTIEDEKLCLEWINSARLSIEQLLKWKDRLLPPEESKEDIGKLVVECIKDFPPEYVEKFLQRWSQCLEKK
jgi:hypothetical protein